MITEAAREHAHYTVLREELYKVREASISEHITRWENPFFPESFPTMDDMNYSAWFKRGSLYMAPGTREDYDKTIDDYRKTHYIRHHDDTMVNNAVVSITKPRIYNVTTGDTIKNELVAHLNKDTKLVIKVVDLGAIYDEYMYDRKGGDDALREIYNEIRVGFFLNELRYVYPKCLTHHFMSIIDWFVSDINLYPKSPGYGPYQYIVSETLDIPFYEHLIKKNNMYTLKCALWGIAQPLEAAWATNKYLHFDLHYENVMMKEVVPQSTFYNKNFLYTRVFSDKTYMLAQTGTHNKIVKLLDFGRNRMEIPENNRTKDLFEHINKATKKHTHNALLQYDDAGHGIGLEGNRTWDMRRIMWDMLNKFPADYWKKMKNDAKEDFDHLVTQMSELIDIDKLNEICLANSISTVLFKRLKDSVLTIEDILMNERKSNSYRTWFEGVRKHLIWSTHQTQYNVTTFLSSPFFTEFEVKPSKSHDNVDKYAWLGERPYPKPLPLNETY